MLLVLLLFLLLTLTVKKRNLIGTDRNDDFNNSKYMHLCVDAPCSAVATVCMNAMLASGSFSLDANASRLTVQNLKVLNRSQEIAMVVSAHLAH